MNFVLLYLLKQFEIDGELRKLVSIAFLKGPAFSLFY